MIKIFFMISLIFLLSCASFVQHPLTGEQIAIPPNMADQIDFDLTISYKTENIENSNNGKVISRFENSGITFELTSLNPLLGNSETEIQLGDLFKEATTFVKLNVKELDKGVITISIIPTYGGAQAGTTQKWILIKSKEYLLEKLDNILNPLGFYIVAEEPLKIK